MFSRPLRAALALTTLALAACSTPPKAPLQEDFVSTGASPYTHTFQVTSTEACEGARRALLSQGYMTTLVRPDTVDASKNFQPASDSHFTVEFHIVCTAGDDATNSSIVYANAVQNGYALKKSDTSASVGLSVLGSLSLPIRQNNDAMVKISSETIQSGRFYDGFFGLISHYLANVVRTAPVPSDTVATTPLPAPQTTAATEAAPSVSTKDPIADFDKTPAFAATPASGAGASLPQ
jgi:hypothetical protein